MFLNEVSSAILVCTTARRWDDLRADLEAYARYVRVNSRRVFHAAIAWKLLQHALTLRDAQPFWECLNAAREEIQGARSGVSLDALIAEYRRAVEQRDARDAFDRLTVDEWSIN